MSCDADVNDLAYSIHDSLKKAPIQQTYLYIFDYIVWTSVRCCLEKLRLWRKF